MSLPFLPGALPSEQAYKYVGAKSVFAALEKEYPEHVKPIYTTSRLRVYRREDLDMALAAAAMRKDPLSN